MSGRAEYRPTLLAISTISNVLMGSRVIVILLTAPRQRAIVTTSIPCLRNAPAKAAIVLLPRPSGISDQLSSSWRMGDSPYPSGSHAGLNGWGSPPRST
jgi:hypothetical protein